MSNVVTYTETFRKNYDPTHTTALRAAFVKEMRMRFRELSKSIVKSVAIQDCFGISKPQTLQVTPTGERAFAFGTSAQKVEAFMAWLQEQVDKGILTIGDLERISSEVGTFWANKYVWDSYKRGIARARYELQKAGYNVPTIEQTGGIEISMSTPIHLDKLGLLYIRVFNELKGISDQMDAIISRILAQGLADGDGPKLLARKIYAAIDGAGLGELGLIDKLGRFIPAIRRAEILARTEVIRAHHLAMIEEYRSWGVLGITVLAEWSTAKDNRVCDRCNSLEGKVFTLDEIAGMIPYHPQCRCIAIPIIMDKK